MNKKFLMIIGILLIIIIIFAIALYNHFFGIRVKVGDYIDYEKYINSSTITISKEDSGFYEDVKTATDSTTKWRVVHLDSKDRKIWLVPEEPVSEVGLKGMLGYLNGEKIINDACRELYSSEKLSVEARSMTTDDLDIATRYDKSLYKNQFADYGKTREVTWRDEFLQDSFIGYSYNIKGEKQENQIKGGSIVVDENNNYEYICPEEDNPVIITQTYYSYNPKLENKTVGKILSEKLGWLSSSCVYANELCANFCIRHVSANALGAHSMVDSARATGGAKEGIRPLVKLSFKTNLELTNSLDEYNCYEIKIKE